MLILVHEAARRGRRHAFLRRKLRAVALRGQVPRHHKSFLVPVSDK